MEDNNTKEVYFDFYCPRCLFFSLEEAQDPCWDCLKEGSNENSHKPVMYKPKESNKL